MQWRIRKHDPVTGVPRCDCVGNLDSEPIARVARRVTNLSLAQQDDRTPRTQQKTSLQVADFTESFGRFDVGNHDGKRLLVALFSPPQFGHGAVIARVTNEVKSPKTFERANFSVPKRCDKSSEWITRFNPLAVA